MVRADWTKFGSMAEMATRVAAEVASLIKTAISSKGFATLAVAGGKTPVPALRELARYELDWSAVTMLPTDDRLVSVDDPLSNAGLIRNLFGPTGAIVLTLVDDPASSPAAAGRTANKRLQTLSWPLDLVWLGMGEDGHTASILRGPDFEAALDAPATQYACGVLPDPLPKEAPVDRVTLTSRALVNTRALMLTINGDRKRAVAEQAIHQGSQSTTAIGQVLALADVPIQIFWSP
jgi:6-phosphogluconolactonase